jgi:hypothetical protein
MPVTMLLNLALNMEEKEIYWHLALWHAFLR